MILWPCSWNESLTSKSNQPSLLQMLTKMQPSCCEASVTYSFFKGNSLHSPEERFSLSFHLRVGKFLKHIMPPDGGRNRICTTVTGLLLRVRHKFKSSLPYSLAGHLQEESQSDSGETKRNFKIFKGFMVCASLQTPKSVAVLDSIMTMFRNKACL